MSEYSINMYAGVYQDFETIFKSTNIDPEKDYKILVLAFSDQAHNSDLLFSLIDSNLTLEAVEALSKDKRARYHPNNPSITTPLSHDIREDGRSNASKSDVKPTSVNKLLTNEYIQKAATQNILLKEIVVKGKHLNEYSLCAPKTNTPLPGVIMFIVDENNNFTETFLIKSESAVSSENRFEKTIHRVKAENLQPTNKLADIFEVTKTTRESEVLNGQIYTLVTHEPNEHTNITIDNPPIGPGIPQGAKPIAYQINGKTFTPSFPLTFNQLSQVTFIWPENKTGMLLEFSDIGEFYLRIDNKNKAVTATGIGVETNDAADIDNHSNKNEEALIAENTAPSVEEVLKNLGIDTLDAYAYKYQDLETMLGAVLPIQPDQEYKIFTYRYEEVSAERSELQSLGDTYYAFDSVQTLIEQNLLAEADITQATTYLNAIEKREGIRANVEAATLTSKGRELWQYSLQPVYQYMLIIVKDATNNVIGKFIIGLKDDPNLAEAEISFKPEALQNKNLLGDIIEVKASEDVKQAINVRLNTKEAKFYVADDTNKNGTWHTFDEAKYFVGDKPLNTSREQEQRLCFTLNQLRYLGVEWSDKPTKLSLSWGNNNPHNLAIDAQKKTINNLKDIIKPGPNNIYEIYMSEPVEISSSMSFDTFYPTLYENCEIFAREHLSGYYTSGGGVTDVLDNFTLEGTTYQSGGFYRRRPQELAFDATKQEELSPGITIDFDNEEQFVSANKNVVYLPNNSGPDVISVEVRYHNKHVFYKDTSRDENPEIPFGDLTVNYKFLIYSNKDNFKQNEAKFKDLFFKGKLGAIDATKTDEKYALLDSKAIKGTLAGK